MERNEREFDAELLNLGAVTEETKGVAPNPLIDSQGQFGGGGLSDD